MSISPNVKLEIGTFRKYRQADASEFMIQLLTHIFSKSSNLEQLFTIKVKNITKCTSCNNINESIVTDNYWTLYLEVLLKNFCIAFFFNLKLILRKVPLI